MPPPLTTLVSFNGTDGTLPTGSLIADASGDLFGTTAVGGADDAGTVFEIAKTAIGYAAPTTLVSFNGGDGANPGISLITDANGDLFGAAFNGGAHGDGTVFEIPKTASGYASTPTTLVSFNGGDGSGPTGSLITDANGDLFGATFNGGAGGAGTVFEIAKTTADYASTPTTLASFNGTDGRAPNGSLIADANGDLFGTTFGEDNAGKVFEIAKTSTGYASTPTILVSFNGTNGLSPAAGLIADANGDLFGTTDEGGAHGDGTVFEIAKTATGYASTPTTLVSFNGSSGSTPRDSLIADANGDLFGTTQGGGTNNDGTVFEIAKTSTGYANSPTTVLSFNGSDGIFPDGSLLSAANGDLFGTTEGGGTNNDGTVFEIRTVVSSGGRETVYTGGSTSGFVIAADGREIVSGGVTYGTVVGDLAAEIVFSGGVASGTVVSGTTASSGGRVIVAAGGTASDTTVFNGGTEVVLAGGVAISTAVSSGGFDRVYSGGTASATQVYGGGIETVSAGGTSRDARLSSGGTERVLGTASGTVVVNGGIEQVLSGGTAVGTIVSSGGKGLVYSASTASGMIVSAGGIETEYVGGTISGTTVSSGGIDKLHGVAHDTAVFAGGTELVLSGGTAISTTVSKGGYQSIYSGGTASDTIIRASTEKVFSGGTAVSPTLDNYARLILHAGALVGGTISFVGTNDALVIAASTPPADTISGFAPTDTIDLVALAYNTANTVDLLPGNVLQINVSGGGTEDLNLAATDNYAGKTFALISGAFGGTGIIVHS
jgi:autotransporter passenger strand-loop-strand repeat protein/uncharacterized repeat protein (TIGR03803 family)